VLLGDPGQLTSVEAGAVLGDVVGPAAGTLRMSEAARSRLSGAVGHDVAAEDPPEGVVLGDGIVVLDRVRRYGSGIAAVAEAIRRGDADAMIAALEGGAEDVQWIAEDVAAPGDAAALDVVREGAGLAGRDRGRPPPRPRVPDPHPRVALHGGHACAAAPRPRRARGDDPRGGGAADRAGVGVARAPLGQARIACPPLPSSMSLSL